MRGGDGGLLCGTWKVNLEGEVDVLSARFIVDMLIILKYYHV